MQITQALNDGITKVMGWVEALIRNLPEIITALLVVVIFSVAARIVRNLVERIMRRVTDHGPIRSLAGTAAYLGVWALGVFLALGILELDTALTSLLAGLGIVGLALGFAFQDIATNFVSGVLMTLRRPFTDGDLIETNDFFGRVETIDLRATHLRTLDGKLVLIPNGQVFGNPIVNYTHAAGRLMELACGVTCGDDLEKVRSVALDAMRSVEPRDGSRDPEFFYQEFGGSSINFVVRVWVDDAEQSSYLAARSNAVVRLKKAFDENGIGIPFPITTLDFSQVGGRTLDEPLEALRRVS